MNWLNLPEKERNKLMDILEDKIIQNADIKKRLRGINEEELFKQYKPKDVIKHYKPEDVLDNIDKKVLEAYLASQGRKFG